MILVMSEVLSDAKDSLLFLVPRRNNDGIFDALVFVAIVD
jgi:hypothetical protein